LLPQLPQAPLLPSNNNSNNNDFLKFKFDLKGYDSNNISLSIKHRSVLQIHAFRTINDAQGKPKNEEFNHEIALPSNVEIFNIRNCFDEADGVLRIEIPLSKPAAGGAAVDTTSQLNNSSTSSTLTQCSSSESAATSSQGNNSSVATRSAQKKPLNKNEKYLELTFDLYDFKFDDIKIESGKILVVSAFKDKGDDKSMHGFTCSPDNDKIYTRKYVLPSWVRSENIIVSQEKRRVDSKLKNLLILQLPIVS
jgi:HSP20 family molecular chaperone IbpA